MPIFDQKIWEVFFIKDSMVYHTTAVVYPQEKYLHRDDNKCHNYMKKVKFVQQLF